MTLDFTRLIDRLDPPADGETPIRHRTGIVDAVNSDGTVDLILSGVVVPSVAVLSGASAGVGEVVEVAAWSGDLLVLGAAGGPNPLGEAVATGSVATLSVGDIPQTHQDLKIVLRATHDGTAAFLATSLRFNATIGTSYSSAWHRTAENGSTETGGNNGGGQINVFVGSSFTSIELTLPDYAQSIPHGVSGTGQARIGSGASNASRTFNYGGNWNVSAAITEVRFVVSANNFAAGSTLKVYGL